MGSHYNGSQYKEGSLEADPNPSKKVWTIKPRALDIVWGADKRYWRINESDGSAELIQVCWLEVTGSFPAEKLGIGKYKLNFGVKMKADAFGWKNCPVAILVRVGDKAQSNMKKLELVNDAVSTETVSLIPRDDLVFEIKESNTDKVIFGLFEIWRERWKGGMIINKVIIEKIP